MEADSKNLRELAALFLRLGATSFGGPAAHIALMEDEVVTRRQWLSRQEFLDLVGATNLIPGPNSTELAIHIGKLRAGWPGLIMAGAAFILPAVLIVLALAWAYERYGALPQMRWLLYGVQPVVIAIIAQALWKLARTALKGVFPVAVALLSIALVAAEINEVAVIALAAGIGLVAGWMTSRRNRNESTPAPEDVDPMTAPPRSVPAIILFGGSAVLAAPTVWSIFLVFLKIGSVIYGSGYVLLAFLRADLVERLHWLSDQQLVDAVAVGQMTPGPVFTTATFIGYQIAGVPGALAATLGIFLPSFLFVGFLSLVMAQLRDSPVARVFLDAVNAASLALMATVTFQLLRIALMDARTVAIAVAALATLLMLRLNSAWLIGAGAVLGLLAHGR
ncbi:MAG TPA: chromate efflux transporter [Abditibacteriaceae bacterium]|nr:chromate efflux transporter [Abditibacteriaceae bacterium]